MTPNLGGMKQSLCILMVYVGEKFKEGRAGPACLHCRGLQPPWKTCSLGAGITRQLSHPTMTFHAGCQLRPQLGMWPEHLLIASPCGLGFLTTR